MFLKEAIVEKLDEDVTVLVQLSEAVTRLLKADCSRCLHIRTKEIAIIYHSGGGNWGEDCEGTLEMRRDCTQ